MTHTWDGVTLERLLSTPRLWAVAQRFMPVSSIAVDWKIFGTGAPNQWVAVHRGHFFHLANRVKGGAKFDLVSLDKRIDALEALEAQRSDQSVLRLRGIWYNDKSGSYTWYVDWIVPENQPAPMSWQIEEMLESGTSQDDGQAHFFDVEVRRMKPYSDHFDIDHYSFYDRLPSYV
jgi:hypothetical protein